MVKFFFSSEKGLYAADNDKSTFVPWFLNEKDSLFQKLWIHDLFKISENTYLVTNGEQKGLSFLSIAERGIETEPHTLFASRIVCG